MAAGTSGVAGSAAATHCGVSIHQTFLRNRTPQSLTSRQGNRKSIQINVGANPLSDSGIEVSVKLEGKARQLAPCYFVSTWNSPAFFASETFRKRV
jgi:hypothetical protein